MTLLIIFIAVVVVLAIAFLALGSLFAIAMFGEDEDHIVSIDDIDLP
jgi:hypothetical protein